MSAPADPWEGDRVTRWLHQARDLERQLAPVSEVLFAAAALAPGERVLDVGCGTGPTTRRAAQEIGETGAVTGLDIAADMLAAADASTAADPLTGRSAAIDWLAADVVSWEPEPAVYDVVISRFGVMFFDDPDAAFANLATATRPGGRLTMAAWARRDESDLFEVPLRAAVRALRAHGLPEPSNLPVDAGAYSLSNETTTAQLLERTGWTDVNIETHDLALRVVGGAHPDQAAIAARDFGATRLALAGLEPSVIDEATAAIAADLAEHVDERGEVVLNGRVRIITARRLT